ncbi:MAG: 30S ribosomal protein S13 [Candidatus Micrarchaeota archaeon]|nr:30S ribosomal protein S13 [Candidatus Micrarchaeota archaeon]
MAKDNIQNPKSVPKESDDFRGIVHILGTDVKGNVKLSNALRQVKGVGYNLSKTFANVISKEMKIEKDVQIGRLSEEQVEKIEEMIKNPSKYGIPSYLFNRRKDLETGRDTHVAGPDVAFATRSDVERHKTLYTWRGYRHAYGQKVRGQGTRTSGRKGLTMGVIKSKTAPGAAAKPAESKQQAQAKK